MYYKFLWGSDWSRTRFLHNLKQLGGPAISIGLKNLIERIYAALDHLLAKLHSSILVLVASWTLGFITDIDGKWCPAFIIVIRIIPEKLMEILSGRSTRTNVVQTVKSQEEWCEGELLHCSVGTLLSTRVVARPGSGLTIEGVDN